MRTRLQPMARVFEKLPRMVRDVARATGREVACHIDGNATEVDKALVEAIRDPLMHIVRNAIDHGIEPEAQRLAAGKPAAGNIYVRAAHKGSMVTIEVEDDGRGMDPKRLRAHAVARQVLSQSEADRLADREVLELVFRPGFSTAERVTEISGRGVGMDVVRSHVEQAGGQAEIESHVGRGSIIRLKMPLTLAIIPALLVQAGQQRFAIPQVNLQELVYMPTDRSLIERVRGAEIYRLRGDLLPILRLNSLLGLGGSEASAARPGDATLIVLSAGTRRFGLVVDAIDNTEEIVVKPLRGQLKRLNCFCGATVLGDGNIALILDVAGVAQRAGLSLSQKREAEAPPPPPATPPQAKLMVFRSPGCAPCAVPLNTVARLEQVPARDIEQVGDGEWLQYRGILLPILRPERVLAAARAEHEVAARPAGPAAGAAGDDGPLQLLVVFNFGQPLAMAVDAVLDIAEVTPLPQAMNSDTPFARGKVVVFGHTTLLLDVVAVARALAPTLLTTGREAM